MWAWWSTPAFPARMFVTVRPKVLRDFLFLTLCSSSVAHLVGTTPLARWWHSRPWPGYLKSRISDFALHLLGHFLANDQVWFGSKYSLRNFVRVAAIIVYRLPTLHWGVGGDVKRGVLFAMKGQHFRRSRVCWYRHF